MILSCPECATSYFVDDSRIPVDGRRVKCSSCGHRWLAGPEGPILEADSFEPTPEPVYVEPAAVAPEVEVEAVPEEVEPPPVRRPARRVPPARADGRSSALVWAGAAVLAAALIAGVVVFREQVVRIWPKSSAAYAGLGLEVAGGGLVLEQVQVKPDFLGGHPILAVTGAIRNVRDVPVDAPPVRLTLLNRAGQPVAAKIARPDDATIPAGALRRFAVNMLDPPATARDLEVRFDAGGHGKPVRTIAAAEPPVAETPTAPPPVEAVPAPADAPALSPAAATEHG
ncbi:zinc-ribbon domain-containing protein [Phenylobacterium sp. LjRoot225]|uniref:DUF3426 domain-containing protein n=1 Tax=Phenylobacterium sp. LjRoot225 TaxID=3342285 RepID=UPI003ED0F086